MEVSYNLRYKKSNFSNRLLIDKEGEVIVYGKGFRLKGKGAGDKGELINFSEIKEFYFRDEKLIFITFAKEKYVLDGFGTQFDQFLVDMYRARNEFLMDALFMKGGKLKAEYDAHFDRTSKFGKPINKGNAKLKLYEKTLVVVPATQDAFSIPYDFVNFHEFDDMEYTLKVVMDDGVTVMISQLNDDFELFQEKMNDLLGGLYAGLVNDVLREAFGEYRVDTLLKLAYLMKGGKAVSLKDISKIDKELAESVDKFIFEDEAFADKVKSLREMVDEHSICYGIAKDETVKEGLIKWFMLTIPEYNIVMFSILPRWQHGAKEEAAPEDMHDAYFYRIIVEKGNPADKVEDKIREIEQALVVLHFAKDPCYKDKRDLRHSPYQYAIRKLPFLRILRKSFAGKAASKDVKDWQKQAQNILDNAKLKS